MDFHKLIEFEEAPGMPIKYLDSQVPLTPVDSKSLQEVLKIRQDLRTWNTQWKHAICYKSHPSDCFIAAFFKCWGKKGQS